MSLLVGFLVEGEGLLAVRLVGNHGLGATIIQPLAQRGAVVSPIAEKPRGRLGLSDQALSRRAIMGFATTQEDGQKTTFSICNCVDFRVAPAARASNRLVLLPLFPPDAERWALM